MTTRFREEASLPEERNEVECTKKKFSDTLLDSLTLTGWHSVTFTAVDTSMALR